MNMPSLMRRWLGFPEPERDREPVGPAPFAVPPDPVRPPWEAAVRASPADPDALRAYGQALSEALDPRGPLVMAMLAGSDGAAEIADEPALLGPLNGAPGVQVTWRAGFWTELKIDRAWEDGTLGALLRAALAHPAALLLERLDVRADTVPAVPDALADSDPLRLTSLVVRATTGQAGSWAAVWPRVQRLRSAEILGDDPQLGDIALPDLEDLRLAGRMDVDALWSLARMYAPSLRRLEVRGLPADAQGMRVLQDRFPFAILDPAG